MAEFGLDAQNAMAIPDSARNGRLDPGSAQRLVGAGRIQTRFGPARSAISNRVTEHGPRAASSQLLGLISTGGQG